MVNGYNAYNTHQSVLMHVLTIVTTGSVLEFGMGEGSTHFMHAICEKQGRKLLSLDNSQKWIDKYINYKSPSHEIAVFKPSEILLKACGFFNEKFSVVFVDAAPAEIRQPFFILMKNQVDYFIVHDTEAKAYNWNFKNFKHVLEYTKETPRTTVLSDLDVIDERILEVFK